MPDPDPIAGAGLIAALVRGGCKRFRYRSAVHHLVGARPVGVQSIARAGRHGAPVVLAPPRPAPVSRHPGANAPAMSQEVSVPAERTLSDHGPARRTRSASIEPGEPGKPGDTSDTGAARPVPRIERAIADAPSAIDIEAPGPPLPHASAAVRSAAARSRTSLNLRDARSLAHPADDASAMPSIAVPSPPRTVATATAVRSPDSHPAAAGTPPISTLTADLRMPPTDPRTPTPDRRSATTDPRSPAADPRSPTADPRSPAADPRSLTANPRSPDLGRRVHAMDPRSRSAERQTLTADPAPPIAEAAPAPGPTARAIAPSPYTAASAPVLERADARGVADGRQPPLPRLRTTGPSMPRSDLDALAAVPRLSTLWQARSSADARLRSEVLDLTREVAALRQSQREAANRPAAPRTPPTPPAPPVAARPAQAPSDAMWARHRAGALRFRLGRP